jgi:hypothetical protein
MSRVAGTRPDRAILVAHHFESSHRRDSALIVRFKPIEWYVIKICSLTSVKPCRFRGEEQPLTNHDARLARFYAT